MKGKNISLDAEAVEILEKYRFCPQDVKQSYSVAVKNLENEKEEYRKNRNGEK